MKKLFLSVIIILMVVSCTNEPVEQVANAKGQIIKTVEVDDSGESVTFLYSYVGGKINEIKATSSGIDIKINFSYVGAKLMKTTFDYLLVTGYESYFYTGDLITKSEFFTNWTGKSNITYKYNTLNQIIESTEIDGNNSTTITKYTYNSQGNKASKNDGTSTIYYEYDNKINPLAIEFSKEVSMVMGVSITELVDEISTNNLTKETDGPYITTYSYTYNTEGKPMTKKTYENGDLLSTTTYFYN